MTQINISSITLCLSNQSINEMLINVVNE